MTDRPLVVLGATGSIGRQTLDVAAVLGREVTVLAARRPSPEFAELAADHPDATVVVTGGSGTEREEFAMSVGNRVEWGSDALVEVAGRAGSIVVNGLVGAAGLRPTMAALAAGNRVALANKETLVAAGPLVMDAVGDGGELIPVDSEHSALFQLVAGTRPDDVATLVLTASGGPFRGWSADRLESVTPAQALAHPTWEMGRRISIDSATLCNKGLEVIEAHVLFGIPFDRIEVVVHPRSTVHSLVRMTDGALLAHLGAADMRIPIAYAITHPERRWPAPVPFDLVGLDLTFEEVDRSAFPALDLAYAVGREGGTAPCVFNAADEIAVHAFLEGRLGFTGIVRLVELVLDEMGSEPLESVDHVLEVDRQARETAASLVAGAC